PSFFQVGGTLPPMCRINRVVPPPPYWHDRAIRQNPGKPTDSIIHAGNSTRTAGFGHAEKVPNAGRGARGYPLAPSLHFFKRGVPPTHMAGQQVGTLPPAGLHGGSTP